MILMSWSIQKCKNRWIFENIPPSVDKCENFLLHELKWLLESQPISSKWSIIMDAYYATVASVFSLFLVHF
jgi:hypothetical protein